MMTAESGMRVHVTHAACSTATTESMAMVSLLRMNGAASGVPVWRSGGRKGKGEKRTEQGKEGRNLILKLMKLTIRIT